MACLGEKIILGEARFLDGGAGVFERRLAKLGLRDIAKDGDYIIALAYPFGTAVFPAAARPHLEPKENRLGVAAAVDPLGTAPTQGRVDRHGAGACVRDGLQKGGSVSNLEPFEKAASRQCASPQAEQGLAIRTDR